MSPADHCARIGYPTLRLPAHVAQIRIAEGDAARSTHADHKGHYASARKDPSALGIGTVKSASAATATGKATIKAGKATVRMVALEAGKGSCALATTTLRPGTYQLSASYAGSANFTGSTSTKRPLWSRASPLSRRQL